MNKIFSSLTPKQKIRWLWDYYKIPAGLVLLAAIIVIPTVVSIVTKPKTVLTVGVVNVSTDENAKNFLTDGFMKAIGESGSHKAVDLEDDLTLSATESTPSGNAAAESMTSESSASGSADSESAAFGDATHLIDANEYASKVKLMALTSDGSLDVLLMDEEALKVLEADDSFLNLRDELTGSDAGALHDDYVIALNSSSAFAKASGISGKVYAGIVSNTKKKKQALRYLEYLLNE